MKLIPIAKPIKIRIKSGGEEHSSLDSLKCYFNVDDICLLLDGRLVRWLRQQGENALASSIDCYEISSLNDEDSIFSFISLFYETEITDHQLTSLLDLADFCFHQDKYRNSGIGMYKYLLAQNLSLAKQMFYSRGSLPQLNDISWIQVFSHLEGSKDAELLFLLGQLWNEGEGGIKDCRKGNAYIQEAAKLEWHLAIEYIKSRNRFYDVDKQKILDWYSTHWDKNFAKYSSLDYSKDICTTHQETDICYFISACYKIAYDYHWHNKGLALKTAEKYLDMATKIPEAQLVLAILKKAAGVSYRDVCAVEKCKLVSIFLSEQNHPFKRLSIVEKLKYIIEHLFDE